MTLEVPAKLMAVAEPKGIGHVIDGANRIGRGEEAKHAAAAGGGRAGHCLNEHQQLLVRQPNARQESRLETNRPSRAVTATTMPVYHRKPSQPLRQTRSFRTPQAPGDRIPYMVPLGCELITLGSARFFVKTRRSSRSPEGLGQAGSDHDAEAIGRDRPGLIHIVSCHVPEAEQVTAVTLPVRVQVRETAHRSPHSDS